MDISNNIHIGINVNQLGSIQNLLSDSSISNLLDKVKQSFNIDFSIIDNTSEYEYTEQFLRENNLKDENLFFQKFDIIPFSKQIEFIPYDVKYLEIVEPIMLIIAQRFSQILNTKCILFFKNLSVPIALFNSGRLEDSFDLYNNSFFADKIWCVKSKYIFG